MTLMPLTPGDPLTLNRELYHAFHETDHAQENEAIVAAHTFPWVGVITVLLIMGALPFFLSFLRKRLPKTSPFPTKETLIQKIGQLSQLSDRRAAVFQLAELFKLPFQTLLKKATAPLTFQEILLHLEQKHVLPHSTMDEIKQQFEMLDTLRFDAPTPTREQLHVACQSALKMLNYLPYEGSH